MRFRFLLSTTLLFSTLSLPTYAACTNPAGVEGDQIYNSTYDVMQFCNGSNQWVNMGAAGGTAGGTAVDADNDTKIQVEESSDEDKIRFDTAVILPR